MAMAGTALTRASAKELSQTGPWPACKLTIRRDTKEQPVYVLTVGKSGAKLQRSKLEEKDCDDPAHQCHFGTRWATTR